MRFTWLNKQGVRSDAGFVVQSVDRSAFEYREEDRVMRLEGEAIVGGLDGHAFRFGFHDTWRHARWQSPHHWDAVSGEDRERIRNNVAAALSFMDGKPEFD